MLVILIQPVRLPEVSSGPIAAELCKIGCDSTGQRTALSTETSMNAYRLSPMTFGSAAARIRLVVSSLHCGHRSGPTQPMARRYGVEMSAL